MERPSVSGSIPDLAVRGGPCPCRHRISHHNGALAFPCNDTSDRAFPATSREDAGPAIHQDGHGDRAARGSPACRQRNAAPCQMPTRVRSLTPMTGIVESDSGPGAQHVHIAESAAGWRAVPAGIWALGFVSMFMDISSEMIHALLPIYLVTVLGTSTLTVGF